MLRMGNLNRFRFEKLLGDRGAGQRALSFNRNTTKQYYRA